jgi:hypothetical protein
MSTNIQFPFYSSPLDSTEYANLTTAKAVLLKQIADVANINRSMKKVICSKAIKDETFEMEDTSIAYPNKYTYNCISRLRVDLPIDLTGSSVTMELWMKAVAGPSVNNGGTGTFVATQASSSGASYEWRLDGSLEVPTLSSDTYMLCTLRGTVYPQKKLNVTIDPNEPQWLDLYITNWSGNKNDIPFLNAITLFLNEKQEMNVDLDVSTSPNNTLNGAVLTPYINQKITAEDWRDYRHSLEKVHEASTHHILQWMDLEDNINESGYNITVSTATTNVLNLDQFVIPKLGCEEDGDVGTFAVGFYCDVVSAGNYTFELEFYDETLTTFARVWSDSVTADGWVFGNFSADLSNISSDYIRGRLMVSLTTGSGDIETNGFSIRKYRY